MMMNDNDLSPSPPSINRVLSPQDPPTDNDSTSSTASLSSPPLSTTSIDDRNDSSLSSASSSIDENEGDEGRGGDDRNHCPPIKDLLNVLFKKTRLYVEGMPYHYTNDQVRAMFERASAGASIAEIYFLTRQYYDDKNGIIQRGLFVQFHEPEAAARAQSMLHNRIVGGCTLRVKYAKDKKIVDQLKEYDIKNGNVYHKNDQEMNDDDNKQQQQHYSHHNGMNGHGDQYACRGRSSMKNRRGNRDRRHHPMSNGAPISPAINNGSVPTAGVLGPNMLSIPLTLHQLQLLQSWQSNQISAATPPISPLSSFHHHQQQPFQPFVSAHHPNLFTNIDAPPFATINPYLPGIRYSSAYPLLQNMTDIQAFPLINANMNGTLLQELSSLNGSLPLPPIPEGNEQENKSE